MALIQVYGEESPGGESGDSGSEDGQSQIIGNLEGEAATVAILFR